MRYVAYRPFEVVLDPVADSLDAHSTCDSTLHLSDVYRAFDPDDLRDRAAQVFRRDFMEFIPACNYAGSRHLIRRNLRFAGRRSIVNSLNLRYRLVLCHAIYGPCGLSSLDSLDDSSQLAFLVPEPVRAPYPVQLPSQAL